MNGRMIVGALWIGLIDLLAYSRYSPTGAGPALLLAGSIVLAMLIFLWGLAGQTVGRLP